MNLFRKHKKFEEQLNEQLGDMEVKPSASLWDRIDSEIADESFEHDMQGSLENFEQMPYPETWDKIAAELPEEKVRNNFAKYYLPAALALLFVSGVYIGKNWDFSPDNTTAYVVPEKLPETRDAAGPIPETIIPAERPQPGKKAGVISEQADRPEPVNGDALIKNQRTVSDNAGTVSIPKPEVRQLADSRSVADRSSPENNTSNEPAAGLTLFKGVDEKNVEDIKSTEPQAKMVSSEDKQMSEVPVEGPEHTNPKVLQVAETLVPVREGDAETMPLLPTGNHPVMLQQPKEVPVQAQQPDSVFVAQQAGNNKSYRGEEPFTAISISIYAGLNDCFTTYNDPKVSSTLNFDKNIALRKELERPTVDWSGGFLLDYRVGAKWMISCGVMMVNFNQKFDYTIEKAQNPSNVNETGAPASNPADSFVIGNQYSNRIKFSWTDIPLYFNYNIIGGGRWNLDMQTGVSYAFINAVDGGMISYDNKGVLVLRGKESFPNIRNTVFVTAMPQLSYQFAPSVSVGFAPTVKYSLTSIIGNERWIQQHPYFLGANICLRKRF